MRQRWFDYPLPPVLHTPAPAPNVTHEFPEANVPFSQVYPGPPPKSHPMLESTLPDVQLLPETLLPGLQMKAAVAAVAPDPSWHKLSAMLFPIYRISGFTYFIIISLRLPSLYLNFDFPSFLIYVIKSFLARKVNIFSALRGRHFQ